MAAIQPQPPSELPSQHNPSMPSTSSLSQSLQTHENFLSHLRLSAPSPLPHTAWPVMQMPSFPPLSNHSLASVHLPQPIILQPPTAPLHLLQHHISHILLAHLSARLCPFNRLTLLLHACYLHVSPHALYNRLHGPAAPSQCLVLTIDSDVAQSPAA